MQKILSKINDLFSTLSGWLMLIMMFILLVDVIWRTFFNPLPEMATISVFVMMIVVYLGMARCEEHDEHVRLEFAIEKTHGTLHRVIVFSVRLCAVLGSLALLISVASDAWMAFHIHEVVPGEHSLPTWPTKFIMVIGAFFFFIQTLFYLFKPLKKNDLSLEDASALL